MAPEFLFKASTIFATCGWIVLFVLYNHSLTPKIVLTGVVIMLSLFYMYLIVYVISVEPDTGNIGSLAGLMALYKSPIAVLAGWVHYLAFDLTIGLFITLNSIKQRIRRLIILPCLLLNLTFGPSGLFLYYIIVCIRQKTIVPEIFDPN